MQYLKSKRGEMMVTVCVILIAAMFVVAFVLKVFPVLVEKQQLNTYASELCRVAVISGRVGDETTEKIQKLNQQMGFSPTIAWSKSGNIQLNDTIEVKCTLTRNLGSFGGLASFPITITGKASDQSEVYWK